MSGSLSKCWFFLGMSSVDDGIFQQSLGPTSGTQEPSVTSQTLDEQAAFCLVLVLFL